MARVRILAALVGLVMFTLPWARSAAAIPSDDRKARAMAQTMLQKARTPQHRRLHRLIVPDVPVPLPRRYSIVVLANYHSSVRASGIIEVTRDADGARVEQLGPDGIDRAPLPPDEVDAFVRLAYYLTAARAEARWNLGSLGPVGTATHAAWHQIRIQGEGLSITTAFMQPIMREVDSEELDWFVLTAIVGEIYELMDLHVTHAHRVPLDETMVAEIEQRLRSLPPIPVVSQPYDQPDEDSVRARLLGNLLLAARVARAEPLLLRKGLDRQAYLLSLQTLSEPDLRLALPGLLCSEDPALWRPALSVAHEHHEHMQDVIVAAVECPLPMFAVIQILDDLGTGPTAELPSLQPVRRLLAPGTEPRRRLHAAATLWRIRHDEAALALLHSLALGDGRSRSITVDRELALRAVSDSVEPRGPRRRLVSELAAQMLREAPVDASGERAQVVAVMELLSRFGDSDDAQELVRWLDHPDPGLVSDVVESMDRLSPARARDEARTRLSRYVRGATSDGHARAVAPFVQLWIRHEEREPGVIEDLRAAGRKLRAEVPEARDRRRVAHDAAVGYLAAEPEQRAAALVRWLEATPELQRSTDERLEGRHGLDREAIDRAKKIAVTRTRRGP
ncbi:hypothetical protein [Paraliomyxa miuraensis]|uniref:hypothetical protein n=1 Tax=Paraliomyxa miuraensis TaxID=376150 RepID=UPI00225A7701|nr:hypothetical protein [Paraliomyxa miuraensis]MCX4247651.1 hypothetical protein [Paraliomyxa miuraensis]